ncbi:MAG: hypothetical protein HY897_26115 [Deltaproteobacteria bacterium]|nr:hypothetical protein [Deltaproteobacteria bacterium]
MRGFLITLVAVVVAASCSFMKRHSVADYYPLRKDAAWTYRVTTYEQGPAGESLVRTARVMSETGGEFLVKQGDESYTYVRTPEGIMKGRSRSFILKEPVEADAAWTIEVSGGGLTLSGNARVAAVGAAATVPAGQFTDCAVVEETYQRVGRHVSTYCPGTGLVKLEVFETFGNSEKLLRKAELLAHEAGAQ